MGVPLQLFAWVAVVVVCYEATLGSGTTAGVATRTVWSAMDAMFYSIFYVCTQNTLAKRAEIAAWTTERFRQLAQRLRSVSKTQLVLAYVHASWVAACYHMPYLCVAWLTFAWGVHHHLVEAHDEALRPGHVHVREDQGYVICEKTALTDLSAIIRADWISAK